MIRRKSFGGTIYPSWKGSARRMFAACCLLLAAISECCLAANTSNNTPDPSLAASPTTSKSALHTASWDHLNELVLATLNHAGTVANAQHELAQSVGGDERPSARFTWISRFWRANKTPGPAYWIAKPNPRDKRLLLSIYNDGLNLPGRITAFISDGVHWTITTVIEGNARMEPYAMIINGHLRALVIRDVYERADSETGAFQVFEWDADRRSLTARYRSKSLLDDNITFVGRTMHIEYSETPNHIDNGGFLGIRTRRELKVKLTDHDLKTTDFSLTPWLETVDALCGALRQKSDPSRYFANQKLASTVALKDCVLVSEEENSTNTQALVVLGRGAHRIRLTLRQSRSYWRITSIVPAK